jgi:hypothetical protein
MELVPNRFYFFFQRLNSGNSLLWVTVSSYNQAQPRSFEELMKEKAMDIVDIRLLSNANSIINIRRAPGLDPKGHHDNPTPLLHRVLQFSGPHTPRIPPHTQQPILRAFSLLQRLHIQRARRKVSLQRLRYSP